MKFKFKLPNTRLCLVLCFRNGQPMPKVLIPTPPNNEALRGEMLKRKIGYSEIRSVQAVQEESLATAMGPKFSRR